MAAHSMLGLAQEKTPARPIALPVSTHLRIEDRRGGGHLCVGFEHITAWRQELSERSGDDALGVQIYLVNGESVGLVQVGFDFLTHVLQELYGDAFAVTFVANDSRTLYLRRAHILGFSTRQGQTLHVLGGHQFTGVRVTASDLSATPPMMRQQPEPAQEPTTPVQPTQRFPVYSAQRSYEGGEVVLHDGSLYRREGRKANVGDPLQDVANWSYVRTLEGPVPVRSAGQIETASRKPGIAEYNEHGAYGFGDLVKYRGQVYRKLSRHTSGGQPDLYPTDWDHVRSPELLGLTHAG